MNIENDKDLIVDFQQGDQEVFKYIYKLYKLQLYKFVHNLIFNTPESEDIVADCFIKLWNKRAGFDNILKIKAFLFITAHNACIDYLKHSMVENRSQKELAFVLEKNEEFILAKMIKAEVLSEIYSEIENLPTKCRQIFKMLYFQELNYEEVANKLHLKQSAVRSQKRRALMLLRTIIFKNKVLISILIILSV